MQIWKEKNNWKKCFLSCVGNDQKIFFFVLTYSYLSKLSEQICQPQPQSGLCCQLSLHCTGFLFLDLYDKQVSHSNTKLQTWIFSNLNIFTIFSSFLYFEKNRNWVDFLSSALRRGTFWKTLAGETEYVGNNSNFPASETWALSYLHLLEEKKEKTRWKYIKVLWKSLNNLRCRLKCHWWQALPETP